MHLADVRILPGVNSGCVVEGRFNLETPHYPGDELIQAAGAQISFFIRGGTGGSLHLHELARDPRGLFSRVNQTNRLLLIFPAAIDLEQLLLDMSGGAPITQGRRRVEWVELHADCEFGLVTGRIPSLELETKILETGLGVSFRGEVGSVQALGSSVPALADSRISADIIVPWEFLALQESRLANLEGRIRIRNEHPSTPFDFNRSGLAGVAFDRSFGWPFFQSRFALEAAGEPSPCVSARITDTTLVLRPTMTPLLLSDGFAAQPYSSGPTLTLFGLGYDAWAKALNGETTGRLELRGDGIGYLTEASSMGRVAGRHVIAACSIELALGETELVLTIRGEVDRLLQHSGPPLPPRLGPRFDVGVRIPVVFLAARNVDLLRWGLNEGRALDGSAGPN